MTTDLISDVTAKSVRYVPAQSAVRRIAGVFNVCFIAPIIGAPFAGKDALGAPGDDRAGR